MISESHAPYRAFLRLATNAEMKGCGILRVWCWWGSRRKREIYVADRGKKRSRLQLAQAEVANGGCDVQLDYYTECISRYRNRTIHCRTIQYNPSSPFITILIFRILSNFNQVVSPSWLLATDSRRLAVWAITFP